MQRGTKNTTGYVVPADDKENARLIISEIILDVFKGLKMAHPKPSVKRRRETVFDTREVCEVKTYRDEHRLGEQILDERFVGGYE